MAKKQARKQARAAETKPEEVETQPKERLGKHDVEISYQLRMTDRTGHVVNVEGDLPMSGALIPAFLRESCKTIEDIVERLVRDRFLNQVRYYFNEHMERDAEKRQPAPLAHTPSTAFSMSTPPAYTDIIELEYEDPTAPPQQPLPASPPKVEAGKEEVEECLDDE